MKKLVLGIILGDAAGIGPEIVCKMLYKNQWRENYIPVIIGSEKVFITGMEYARVNIRYRKVFDIEEVKQLSRESDSIILFDNNQFHPTNYKIGEYNVQSGKSIIKMIKVAVQLKQSNIVDSITYAPINKKAINMADNRFSDELQLYKHFSNYKGLCLEMNYVSNVWTARVTGHIPLMEVSSYLTIDRILDVVNLTNETLKAIGLESPSLYVSAINPHGGEGGLFGTEELDIITPAIEKAKNEEIKIQGPFPADTIFNKAFSGECDVVITMYHDQGQIALKTKSFSKGVTMLAGLPFVVTTPAHGTGYDIAGKGMANEASLENAIEIALKIIRNS